MRYIEVSADNNYEAGKKIGEQLGDLIREYAEKQKPENRSWAELKEQSKPFLEVTLKTFPQFIEEMKGLGEGARLDWMDLWTLSCLEELLGEPHEKCTSFFVRKGNTYIVGHSEDWVAESAKYLYLQKRTIQGVTVFEFNYVCDLGGISTGVNSYGLAYTVNSLYHSDRQVGIPKKMIARWLSEAQGIELIKTQFAKLKRASGYCHNFVQKGSLLNLETSAIEFDMFEAEGNYFHTNHYTRNLNQLESERLMGFVPTTHLRYELASRLVSKISSEEDMKATLSYRTNEASICGQNTIGSAIFDLESKKSFFAIERPNPESRWQEYDLGFLN